MFKVESKGFFRKTNRYLKKVSKISSFEILRYYGEVGLNALSKATPRDEGLTASSWTFSLVPNEFGTLLVWGNRNVNDGVNVAIIIQYGHSTGTGGWVEGIDYINPAIKPVFEDISKELRKKVSHG